MLSVIIPPVILKIAYYKNNQIYLSITSFVYVNSDHIFNHLFLSFVIHRQLLFYSPLFSENIYNQLQTEMLHLQRDSWRRPWEVL